jgi:alanyl-tRNA synthetase
MSSVNQVRTAFLDFFAKNGHAVVASSPLVPRNDPTLMFTRAGMVQFKNVFTGQETRPYTRADRTGVRAGGKAQRSRQRRLHEPAPHLLRDAGQFSSATTPGDGDPAGVELRPGLRARSKRLLVTIYHDDEVAYRIWKKVTGLGDDKIIRISTSDNSGRRARRGRAGLLESSDRATRSRVPAGQRRCRRRPLPEF